MPTGFYPRALVKNIPPGANDPAIKPRIAILHVAVSNADSLHDFFNGPSGGVESHFYIRFDGKVEQYRSIYWQADANLDANDFAVSIETAGMGAGKWTDAQLSSIKALLSWLHTEAGISLEECTAWDGHGVGYHVMWGSPSHWTPSVKTCPGPERIKQFEDVLIPWMAGKSKPSRWPVRHRIVSANMFVKNDDPLDGINGIIRRAGEAFDWPPDVIAVQEGQRMLADLAVVRGYRLFVARDAGEAGREIPVLLRSNLDCLAVEFHHAADGIKGADPVLDHERGIFVVKYLKRGRKAAVVNTHMGVFGEARSADGRPGAAAEQHATHAHKVARIVARLQRNGYVVHVTADANSRDEWPKALPGVLKAAGLTVTRHGVDLIASDPQRVRASVDVAIIPKAVTGSDAHAAIAIRTTERKRS